MKPIKILLPYKIYDKTENDKDCIHKFPVLYQYFFGVRELVDVRDGWTKLFYQTMMHIHLHDNIYQN